MTISVGLLATLVAKPSKEHDLESFLVHLRELAVAEQGSVSWFAFQIDDATYGIFDTFADTDARNSHFTGEMHSAFEQVACDLLAESPSIRPINILAHKVTHTHP